MLRDVDMVNTDLVHLAATLVLTERCNSVASNDQQVQYDVWTKRLATLVYQLAQTSISRSTWVGCLLGVCRIYVGLLWAFCGIAVGFLWNLCGMSVGFVLGLLGLGYV